LLKWIASLTGLDRSERYIAVARLSLWWERVWPGLWPATGIIGLFATAALFDLFAQIPASLHLILLLVALGLAGYFLFRNFQGFRPPGWQESARRVERDSTLAHRPITERHDRLAAGSGDPVAEALWRAHMKRLLAAIYRLRLRLPSPGLPARDPYALRYVVLLLLVAGFVMAGPDWSRRLAAGFTPDSSAPASSALLDAWITPPAYTGVAPIYLTRTADKPIAVPAGSQLVLRVHEAPNKPSLTIDPTPDGGTPNFTGTSSEYGASVRLTSDAYVSVRDNGRALGRWHIKSIPDQPPVIAFAEPPSKTERNALKIAFTAGDDYGVASARALISPVRAKGKKTISVDLPLAASAKTVTQTVYSDLTENPLAGLDVDIALEAKDGAGQTGRSKSARFKLPARVFTNPLARALIEQRQNLALGGDNAIPKAEHMLEALTIAPDRFYANQGGTYLAIRTAYWELRTERGAENVEQVEALLWQIASGIEQGGLLNAAQQLRELQQLLSEALAQGAPQEVIDALLQRYRDALSRYLQILAENAQPSGGPPPANAKTVSAEDFEKLLKAIQQLAQTGSRDQAQQLLAMMQSLIENMHMAQGGAGKGDTPGDKALSDAIQGLSDLTGRQRALLDKTLREKMGAGDPKDGGAKGLAQQQGKLRDDLNKVLKGLGDQKIPTPDSLGQAGHDMGSAQNQLGSSTFDSAGEAQKNALDDMRNAAGALAKKLMEGKGQGQGQSESHEGEDPLGRAAGGTGPDLGDGTKIPDQSELQRARSILQELRKRAAERGRPQQELDYIDRLLKEF